MDCGWGCIWSGRGVGVGAYPNMAKTTEKHKTTSRQGKPQHHMLRQNTKWSRLRYYPAFTIPTVWGNIYDESWRGFFCITLCFSLCFCLCLFSLSPHILYVILNELLRASTAPSLSPILQLLPFFFSLSVSSLPPLFYSLHTSPPSLPYLLSLFSMYITVYSLGGSPGGIYGNQIARQQPFLPSFPVQCSSGKNQQIKSWGGMPVYMKSSEDIQKALHVLYFHMCCLNMDKYCIH